MTLAFGILLQLVAIGMMFLAFGKRTFLQVGPYITFAAFVYSGFSEMVQHTTGTFSKYRSVTTTYWIDRWTVVLGAALILFSAAYIAAVRARKSAPPAEPEAVERVVTVLDWKILGLLCIPLTAVVGAGAFRLDKQGLAPEQTSTVAGLAIQFLVIALALATISFIVKHPKRLLAPILIQLGVTALIGSRLDLVTGALTTLFGLAVLRRFPSWRSITAGLAVIVFLTVSITAARAHIGREQFQNATLTTRVKLLASGAVAALEGKPGDYQGDSQPLGERLDGNSFPAAELQAQAGGAKDVGTATIVNDLNLAVPSFINPAKLSTSLQARSEKSYLAGHYSILFVADFLPTQFGTMVGYYGQVGLLFLAVIFGGLMGFAERLFRRKLTPSRFVLTLALFTCAVSYEAEMSTYPIEFRGAIAVVIVVWLVDHARQASAKSRARKQQPAPVMPPRRPRIPAGATRVH